MLHCLWIYCGLPSTFVIWFNSYISSYPWVWCLLFGLHQPIPSFVEFHKALFWHCCYSVHTCFYWVTQEQGHYSPCYADGILIYLPFPQDFSAGCDFNVSSLNAIIRCLRTSCLDPNPNYTMAMAFHAAVTFPLVPTLTPVIVCNAHQLVFCFLCT